MKENVYQIWFVDAYRRMLYVDYEGTLEGCINIVNARAVGYWAIMPKAEK